MNRKLICTDLDGTLLFREKDDENSRYIKEEDLAALKKLQEEGHVIAISTGRELTGIRMFLRDSLVAFDYYVGSNGSLILNQNFEIIEQHFIDRNIINEVVSFIAKEFPQYGMMGTDGMQMLFIGRTYENAQVNIEREVIELTVDEFLASDYNLIMMNASCNEDFNGDKSSKTDELQTALTEKFGDRLNIFRNMDFLDFAPLNISKGSAVESIAKWLNFSMDDVYTIGDSWNDHSMFKIGANSFSFHHADDELQDEAKHVVGQFADMAKHILKG